MSENPYDASLAVYSVLVLGFIGTALAMAIHRGDDINILVNGFFVFAQFFVTGWQIAQAVAGAKRL